MVFSSTEFMFGLLPVALLLYWLLPGRDLRILWLTLASYIFYGYWDYRFCALMLLCTAINYYAARGIAACVTPRGRKCCLVVSVAVSLSLLGFFKYCDFGISIINEVAACFRGGPGLPLLHIILPIGISFYIFHSLSYTIDLYRGHTPLASNFWTFACYVSLFPQLVAGPIIRYTDVGRQLEDLPQKPSWEHMALGIWFFVMGLGKKLIVADAIARWSDPLLGRYGSLGVLGSWSAVLGYTVQIYFDFSAYSDMAVGLGLMLGLYFPQNFNSPYKALNISDFWRRWHMSLSSWLRDYLFIPLGGSRGTVLQTLRNLIITMFLGGLWHGAAWVFVLWGLYQGLLLAGHAVCARRGWTPSSPLLSRAMTFLAVVFGWVLFRSSDLHMAGTLLANMLGLGRFESLPELSRVIGPQLPLYILFGLGWAWLAPNTWEYRPALRWRWALTTAAVFGICVLLLSRKSPFLYFQF